ncbi:MAG: phosphodiester glycosidase family protein [bacterium]|nr:phosphodiester glycosidase family protein [bacterium]
MKLAVPILILTVLMSLSPIAGAADQQPGEDVAGQGSAWQKLAPGLQLGEFIAPLTSEFGDSKVRVLRIDTQRYQLRLLNASASKNGRPLTAKQWSQQNGLVAAINASMYQEDYKSSVSLMRTRAHINNPRLSKDMTILAFDRKDADVPRVKLIDRQCEDIKVWQKKYTTMIQSIRMISCIGENVWAQQPQRWSTAAIGIDQQDRILFIHVGSPYSTHDLINILKKLPLDIARAMYAEGGPQAQMYINTGQLEYEFVGSYEIDIQGDMKKLISRPVPNVVGISLKESIKKK